jgi:hypothetical protein
VAAGLLLIVVVENRNGSKLMIPRIQLLITYYILFHSLYYYASPSLVARLAQSSTTKRCATQTGLLATYTMIIYETNRRGVSFLYPIITPRAIIIAN